MMRTGRPSPPSTGRTFPGVWPVPHPAMPDRPRDGALSPRVLALPDSHDGQLFRRRPL